MMRKYRIDRKPLISVVMPVFNAEAYLEEAIESILNQTYPYFELIVIDDASRDGSLAMLRRYKKKDNRIRLIRNKRNMGVALSANRALRHAQGDYIARMDADDISIPDRFDRQIEYLQAHPDVVLLGGQCEVIDAAGKRVGFKHFPLKAEETYEMIFRSIPVQQPSVMCNRKLIPYNFKWYLNRLHTAEEVELLFRLFQFGKIENMDRVLLKYRIHGKNTSLVNPKKTFFLTLRTRIKAVRVYGYKPSIKNILITVVQTVVVTLLPSRMIYPVYQWIRGVKQKTKETNKKLRSQVAKI